MRDADRGLQQFPEPASIWHWRFLVLKAEILRRTGRYDESLALLHEEPPAAFAASEIPVRRKLTQCAAYTFLGRFAEASTALDAANQLIASGQPDFAAEFALRKGTLAFRQGNTEQAQLAFRNALDAARLQNDSFLEIAGLGSLALNAVALEHYDEFLELNKRALELAQKVGDFDSIARIEGNLGWGYRLMGDLKNALDADRKAAEQAQANNSPGRSITWISAMGDVYYEMGDYASAEAKSAEALKLADSLNDTDDAIYCLQNLARVALALGQYDTAKNHVANALSREGQTPLRSRELDSQLISADLSVAQKDFATAESSYSHIAKDVASSSALRWEALAGLAQVHAAQKRNALAEREFRQSILTISTAEDSIKEEEAKLPFLSVAIRFYDQYVNFLMSLGRPVDALKVADLSRAQTLRHGLSLKKVSAKGASQLSDFVPEEVARRQGAVLFFYWLGEKRSFLWTVTPAKVSSFSIPPRAEIDALALKYRESFFGDDDPLDSRDGRGQKLFDILVRPAQKLLPNNARIVVFPDGKLHGLNFDTLIVNEPKTHYWVEDVTITVGNSLSLLARSTRMPPPRESQLLFFGDALNASKEFPPLADAKQEIEALQKHFPEKQRRFFTGGQATPSNYLSSDPGRYAFVHFATHGTASAFRPLESAIILSPEGDRYKLYARDIMGYPLNAYLVSISACSGAGEGQLAGEGLVGLSWSFLRAGAHNVVAALWDVSTASAPRIMDDLYKGISEGQDPATALRNAKLSLLHSASATRRPYYWAPFQLYSGS